MAVLAMELLVAMYSHLVCYVISIASVVSGISVDVFGSCILHYTTRAMYCSCKLRSISPVQSKLCFRNYIIYHLCTVALVFLIVVGYDMAKDHCISIILPNGRCVYTNQHQRGILQVPIAVVGINKIAQLGLFITYLYYTYRLNNDITDPAILEQQKSQLHMVTLVLGAVIGLSYVIYTVNIVVQVWLVAYVGLIVMLFFMQQSVIVAIFMCSKKMRQKYRNCIARNQAEQ